MEQLQSQPFNPSLEKVLKNYQTVAMSSLGGPSRYSWPDAMNAGLLSKLADMEAADHARAEVAHAIRAQHIAAAAAVAQHERQQQRMRDMKTAEVAAAAAAASAAAREANKKSEKYDFESDMLHPPPFPIQQMPVFTPIDQSPSEKTETILEGETIACFIVGGEKRLCLPQILNSVLREFSLQQINGVCDDLHIYCSRCSPEQLEILKFTGVLPFSAPSCGLITKTDAERLGNALLYGVMDKKYSVSSRDIPKKLGENTIRVYHECFGKCRGYFKPELYQTPHCPCIECDECGMTFSPQKFVVHSHKGRENRTVHWGFDSANWRSYLLLAKDQHPEEKYRNFLDEMKAKFDYVNRLNKRKQGVDENGNNKKVKVEDVHKEMCKDAVITSAWSPDGQPAIQRPSAFRPWSPSALAKEGKPVLPEHGTVLVRDRSGIPTYLSMGPPVLLNPERVVPHTAATKFDGHFAPNVSLAPQALKPITPKKEDAESSRTSPESSQDSNTSDEDSHGDLINETCLEQEIDMVRSLLENESLESQTGRDKLLHELARIRLRQEERLQSALSSKKTLQQELEFLRATKKEKLREASETKRNLRKENERLRMEYERKIREINDTNQRLRHDLDLAKSKKCDKTHELGKDKSRLRAENEYLRERLTEVEEERDQLKKELDILRKQLKERDDEENKTTDESKEEKRSSTTESAESPKKDV